MWYMSRNGQQFGPYTAAQLQQMIADEQVDEDILFWKQAITEWVEGSEIPGLFPPDLGNAALPQMTAIQQMMWLQLAQQRAQMEAETARHIAANSIETSTKGAETLHRAFNAFNSCSRCHQNCCCRY
jgi:hypothetical protein